MAQCNESKYIMIEFGGSRQLILAEKLPKYREMEAYTQNLAQELGLSQEMIDKIYTLRIVKESE